MPKCPRCNTEIDHFRVKINGYTDAKIVEGKLVVYFYKLTPRFFCPSEICIKKGKLQLFSNRQKAENFLNGITPEIKKRLSRTTKW